MEILCKRKGIRTFGKYQQEIRRGLRQKSKKYDDVQEKYNLAEEIPT